MLCVGVLTDALGAAFQSPGGALNSRGGTQLTNIGYRSIGWRNPSLKDRNAQGHQHDAKRPRPTRPTAGGAVRPARCRLRLDGPAWRMGETPPAPALVAAGRWKAASNAATDAGSTVTGRESCTERDYFETGLDIRLPLPVVSKWLDLGDFHNQWPIRRRPAVSLMPAVIRPR